MMPGRGHPVLEAGRISLYEHSRSMKLISQGEWGRPYSPATAIQTRNHWVLFPSGLFSPFRAGSLGNSFQSQTFSLSLIEGYILIFHIYNSHVDSLRVSVSIRSVTPMLNLQHIWRMWDMLDISCAQFEPATKVQWIWDIQNVCIGHSLLMSRETNSTDSVGLTLYDHSFCT